MRRTALALVLMLTSCGPSTAETVQVARRCQDLLGYNNSDAYRECIKIGGGQAMLDKYDSCEECKAVEREADLRAHTQWKAAIGAEMQRMSDKIDHVSPDGTRRGH